MKTVGVLLMLVACPMWGSAVGGAPVSVGMGGGLDASTYKPKGLFDVGPALAGFVAWTGSYPRVYRLGAQWTRLERDRHCFRLDGHGSGSSCCGTEVLDLAAVQVGVVWFEERPGWRQGYGGISAGVHSLGFQDDPVEWSPIVSVILGTRLTAKGWSVLIEGGGALVIGSETGFGVIPLRMFVEL